jgi:hypothetical protein
MPKREKRPTDEQQKAKALSRWENEGGAKAKETKRRGPNAIVDRDGGSTNVSRHQIAKQRRLP